MRAALAAAVLAGLLAGCAGMPSATTVAAPASSTAADTGERLDRVPRIAVVSAFEPELALLRDLYAHTR